MGITTNIKNWVNKKISMLSLAMGNVEKNTFSQSGEVLSTDFNQTQRHTQGQLADSLKQGEVTQEVIDGVIT
jgi:tRNA1(Val) A37 N6-methylase TrmN6